MFYYAMVRHAILCHIMLWCIEFMFLLQDPCRLVRALGLGRLSAYYHTSRN